VLPAHNGVKLGTVTAPFDAHSHLPGTDSCPPDHTRVVCGTCESDWEAVLAHAATNARIIPMLGLHPWFVAEASPAWAPRLESLLRSHAVGVGECGLDFARKDTDRAAQEAAFRLQLRLAHILRRPIALHVVRAWGRLVDLLKEEGMPPAAMVHAYSGSPETARTLQSMGVFLSFSGDLLHPDRSRLQESLRAVDASHLLLETDGSADLVRVVAAAASLRSVSAGDLAAQTWENGQRCFKGWLA
jgi:TatD DNase family protein